MHDIENKGTADERHFELLQAVYHEESKPGMKYSGLEARALQSLIAMIFTPDFVQLIIKEQPGSKIYFKRVIINWREEQDQSKMPKLVHEHKPSNIVPLKANV